MEDLRNKDKSIIYIMNYLFEIFGDSYFTIIDAWDGDLFAIGFTKKDKLIYISTWEYRPLALNSFRCYIEFELINEHTLMPVIVTQRLHNVTKEELVAYIGEFMNDNLRLN